MWIKMTDREALTICDRVRDEIMQMDMPLSERIHRNQAVAMIMNIAMETIEQKEKHQ